MVLQRTAVTGEMGLEPDIVVFGSLQPEDIRWGVGFSKELGEMLEEGTMAPILALAEHYREMHAQLRA